MWPSRLELYWGKQHLRGLSLRFRQRDGNRRLLGTIGLKYSGLSIPTSGPVLYFFQVSSVRSYCLPRVHLWMFYLQFSYRNWRHPLPANTISLSFLEMRAMEVFFICPRPIGLASAQENSRGKYVSPECDGVTGRRLPGFWAQGCQIAFTSGRPHQAHRVRTIPMQHGDLGYKLGPNHSKKNGIDSSDLPFATSPSPKFGIPIPAFAFRVREMEVELARTLGSHIFFVGRVVGDERFSEGVEWCVTHGHYQTWRLKSRPGEIESSIAEDARVKLGMATNNGLI